jgi:signal transduction histidine kinase
MIRPSPLSIKQKLILIIMTTTLTGLVACGIAVALYEWRVSKNELAQTLSTLAEVTGTNSTAAMTFRDQQRAEETVRALRAEPHVSLGCIYLRDQSLFAVYQRTNGHQDSCPQAPTEDGWRFDPEYLTLSSGVFLDGERIGTILIRSDLSGLKQRTRLFMESLLLLVSIIGLFTYLVSLKVQRLISRPILGLADIARRISEREDYSLRAEKQSADEVGFLVDSFNGMLQQIEHREKHLATTNEERDRLLVRERQARLEAEDALHAREEFMSIAGHELRTPLTPLKLQVQILRNLLLKQIPADTKGRKELLTLFRSSEQQIDRLSKLVEDLLDISRISLGRLKLNAEAIDLSELVTHILQQYETQLKQAGCEVRFTCECAIVGRWDKLRIEQVVINLLTNAIKYGAGKPIVIHVTKENEQAKVSVQDFGIGITEEDQKRIFERFERAVSVKNFGGFGLGLFISRQIVQAHGGSIRVQSQVGVGSIFILVLPLAKAQALTDAA